MIAHVVDDWDLFIGARSGSPHNDVMYGGCVCGWLDMYICIRSAGKILTGSVRSADEVFTDFT